MQARTRLIEFLKNFQNLSSKLRNRTSCFRSRYTLGGRTRQEIVLHAFSGQCTRKLGHHDGSRPTVLNSRGFAPRLYRDAAELQEEKSSVLEQHARAGGEWTGIVPVHRPNWSRKFLFGVASSPRDPALTTGGMGTLNDPSNMVCAGREGARPKQHGVCWTRGSMRARFTYRHAVTNFSC